MHLYHWEPNANSGKPMLALAEKGVGFESHYIDLLKFDQHQPEYLQVKLRPRFVGSCAAEKMLRCCWTKLPGSTCNARSCTCLIWKFHMTT